jgi:FkbM family methyltransferase
MMRHALRYVRAREVGLRHALWQAVNRNAGGGKWIHVYGDRLLYVLLDDYRAYRIARLGGSQKDKASIVVTMCSYGADLMIDVGANYGELSIGPAARGQACLLFEPNARVVECLRKTMMSYPAVHIEQSAAADHSGQTQFHFCPRASGSGSLSSSVPQLEADVRGTYVSSATVPVQTIDSVVARLYGKPPAAIVMKIDVEGFEREVLAGAEKTLAAARWWRALVEFSPSALEHVGKSAAAEWQSFRRHRGFVLEDADKTRLDDMLRSLPVLTDEVPSRDVEIVLGSGEVNEH